MTSERLAEIRKLRGLMFSPEQIELIMGEKGLAQLILKENSPEWEAAEGGRLEQMAKQRAMIFELAERGSSPAQQMALKLMNDERVNEAGRMAE
jgi:hypothetical protein